MMAKLTQSLLDEASDGEKAQFALAYTSAPDPDFEDLVHSWRRLEDPVLRRLAVRLVRTLAEDLPEDRRICAGFT